MAILKNLTTNQSVILQSQHSFGRNPSISNTHIAERDVSQSHAVVSWKGGVWNIHDHSRNGTLIGKNYIHHASSELTMGEVIQFGSDDSTRFEVINLSPPLSYLKCLDAPRFIELGAHAPEDNADIPDASFFYSSDGQWNAETQEGIFTLKHDQVVTLNGQNWVYIENKVLDETVDTNQLIMRSYFQFVLSPDEEHIFLSLVISNQKYHLGERTFNNLLLALARKRLADYEDGYEFNDQGWVTTESLSSYMSREMMKDVDQYYLNLQIHRMRKQLIKLKPFGYLFSGIVERRLGELRFAHRYFQIMKEKQLLGEIIMKQNIH